MIRISQTFSRRENTTVTTIKTSHKKVQVMVIFRNNVEEEIGTQAIKFSQPGKLFYQYTTVIVNINIKVLSSRTGLNNELIFSRYVSTLR